METAGGGVLGWLFFLARALGLRIETLVNTNSKVSYYNLAIIYHMTAMRIATITETITSPPMTPPAMVGTSSPESLALFASVDPALDAWIGNVE